MYYLYIQRLKDGYFVLLEVCMFLLSIMVHYHSFRYYGENSFLRLYILVIGFVLITILPVTIWHIRHWLISFNRLSVISLAYLCIVILCMVILRILDSKFADCDLISRSFHFAQLYIIYACIIIIYILVRSSYILRKLRENDSKFIL
jgi:hypothetical protein